MPDDDVPHVDELGKGVPLLVHDLLRPLDRLHELLFSPEQDAQTKTARIQKGTRIQKRARNQIPLLQKMARIQITRIQKGRAYKRGTRKGREKHAAHTRTRAFN